MGQLGLTLRHWTSIEDPTSAAGLLFGVHLLLALLITLHVLISRKRPQSAAGWIALTWLSPFVGAVSYLVFGVNRIRRKAERIRAGVPERAPAVTPHEVATVPSALEPLRHSIDHVVDAPLLPGNRVGVLLNGDQAYPAMLDAIANAKSSVAFQTFILDRDDWGRRFVDALAAAKARGVEVRVLLDGVGVWFSWPTIIPLLRAADLRWDRFLWSFNPLRMAFINLRNHRKLLVVDGQIGFTGGMNVRGKFVAAEQGHRAHRDLHFRLDGPVVAELMALFAWDWQWETDEALEGPRWFPTLAPAGDTAARVIPDGPDEDQDKAAHTYLQALACAQERVCILTPYFLPDEPIVWAMGAAVRRGVSVEVVLPARSNQPLAQWAMGAALPDVLEQGVRVWAQPPPFDHSKLMIVDGQWCAVGSCNWDPRSLKLNFEMLVEAYSPDLAAQLLAIFERRRDRGVELTVDALLNRPLLLQVRDGLAHLFAPYL